MDDCPNMSLVQTIICALDPLLASWVPGSRLVLDRCIGHMVRSEHKMNCRTGWQRRMEIRKVVPTTCTVTSPRLTCERYLNVQQEIIRPTHRYPTTMSVEQKITASQACHIDGRAGYFRFRQAQLQGLYSEASQKHLEANLQTLCLKTGTHSLPL